MNAAEHRAVSRALRDWFALYEKDSEVLEALNKRYGENSLRAVMTLALIARRADLACERDEIEDAAIAAGERKRLEVVR